MTDPIDASRTLPRRSLRHGDPQVGWLALRVFATALLLYLGTSGGSLTSTDATVTFDLTRQIVEARTLALSDNLLGLEANRGVDGRYYSQYGIGQSIYGIPFYLAVRTVQDALGLQWGRQDSLLKAGVCLGNTVAAAGTVATVFLAGFAISGRVSAALLAACTCAVGSLLWPYARFGFNAPLTAWLLTGTVTTLWIGLRHERRGPIAVAGALSAAAWLTRHEFALIIATFAAVIAIDWWWRSGGRRHGASGSSDGGARADVIANLLAYLVPAAIGGLLWAAYNVARFGHPLMVGYRPRWSIAGYWGLLFSPGASLLLYSPAVVAGLIGLVVLWRRDRLAALLIAAPSLVYFLFVGALADWAGGRSYGPRYLVPILPLLAIAVAPLYVYASVARRRSLVALVAVSTVIQLPGVLVDYSRVSQTWAATADPEARAHRLEHWASSPWVLDLHAAAVAVPRNVAYITGMAARPAVILPNQDEVSAAEPRDFAQQFAFSLDFWWLYLVYLGALPPLVAVTAGLGCCALVVGLARCTWRYAARFDDEGPDGPPVSTGCAAGTDRATLADG